MFFYNRETAGAVCIYFAVERYCLVKTKLLHALIGILSAGWLNAGIIPDNVKRYAIYGYIERVVNITDTNTTARSCSFTLIIAQTAHCKVTVAEMQAAYHPNDTLTAVYYYPAGRSDTLRTGYTAISLDYDSTAPGKRRVTLIGFFARNFCEFFQCDTVYGHFAADHHEKFWKMWNSKGWEILKRYDYNGNLLAVTERKMRDDELWKSHTRQYKNGKVKTRTRSRLHNHGKTIKWTFKEEGHFCLKRFVSIHQ